MEAKIKKIETRRDHRNGGDMVDATLECRRCGKDYPFSFSHIQAEIRYNYGAEQVIHDYIHRMASPLCNECLVAEPPDLLRNV